MNCRRKKLIHQIATKCAEKGVTVSKDLISFLLTLSELNDSCGVDDNNDGNVDNNNSTSERTISFVTEILIAQSSPRLVTIKIQLYFAKHYSNPDYTIKKHRLRLHKKTGDLVAEICETDRLNSDRDIERLYQKILVIVTLLSGLGNPMIPSVLKEVSVALQSVYQPTELKNYVSLSKREKEEQLMELMSIVAGIRLFNRDCQRGGEGIDDLPGILHGAVAKSRDANFELLEELMKNIYRLTAAVEAIIAGSIEKDNETCPAVSEEYTNEDDFSWAIQLLTACRQQEIYIRKLVGDIDICENKIELLMDRLQERLFKLHDTVRYRTAIPTVQVYPQFIDLADIWMRLQDQVIVLSHINSFLWQLRVLCTKNVNVDDRARLDKIVGDRQVLTDAERLEQSTARLITDCGDCLVYYPNSTKDFEQINLQFLGFCAWTFVAGRGSLIPGNANIGVLKWRAKYFAFSSSETARKFGEHPERFYTEALNLVRRCYEYVHLFQLYDELEAMKNRQEIDDESCHLKIQRDEGIQTDVHILPSHMDENYSSSIWEYRRRALRLATIIQCCTRGTQTEKSNFRNGIYVQAEHPRDRAVQTRRDGKTNTTKIKTYIHGLRGRTDFTQPHVLEIVDDQLFARL